MADALLGRVRQGLAGGDAEIKGLYQYFDQLCTDRLLNGYRYINKESDMDVPGLAKAKKSYHPVMKIKSYKLILKS